MTSTTAYAATFDADIANALEMSDSQTEIVRVKILDLTPAEALERLHSAWESGILSGGWEYYDCTDSNEGAEAWFSRPNGEARIQMVQGL